MEHLRKNIIYLCFCVFAVYFGAIRPVVNQVSTPSTRPQTQSTTTHHSITHHLHEYQLGDSVHMRRPINWQKSSETVAYPNVSKVKDLNVKVSISKNRTYIRDGNRVIYTMYSSAGRYGKRSSDGKRVSDTPTGTFHVQAERGTHFYNTKLHEGANYYTSWLHHGEYLFHSVPTLPNGNYNLKEARKLGKSTGSHGCIRLSVPDAKWMMQNLRQGTKVQIVN